MANAFIASNRGSGWSDARARAALACAALLACLVASGCNTFDERAERGGDDSPGVEPSGPTTPATVPMRPGGFASMPMQPSVPPPPDFGVSGPMMGGCVPCGIDCDNCGSGCACAPGGKPDQVLPWRSPFEDNGGSGWKRSTTPLCAGFDEVWGSDVLRDEHGVYVLVHGVDSSHRDLELPDADGGVIDDGSQFSPEFTRVLFNGGDGWSLRANLQGMGATLSLAALGSSLLVYGASWQGRSDCSAGVISGDRFSCRDIGVVQRVQPVGEATAFALVDATKIFRYDGGNWNELPPSLNNLAAALWADSAEIVIGASGGVIGRRRIDDSDWTFTQSATHSLITALWGQSASDLWAGDSGSRLLHFDGAQWTVVADLSAGASCATRSPVIGVLGVGQHVWVYTANQLSRWDGEKLETFGSWSCRPEGAPGEHIDHVAARGENDVFVTLSTNAPAPPCGGAFVVHYDGAQFHAF